jgi:hypothetical protein
LNNRIRNRRGNKFVAGFILLPALSLSAVQLACTSSTRSAGSVSQVNQQTTTNLEKLALKSTQSVFLKVVILADRSGSVEHTRTPLITMSQLQEVINLLRSHSGEIAFGFIDDDSNRPFLRLRIARGPLMPTAPAQRNNPYEQERLLDQYKRAMRQFNDQLRQWQFDTNQRIETFKTEAQPMIDCLDDKQCRSNTSDVLEGLKRADLFLSENEVVTNQVNTLMLITDGLETTRPKNGAPTLKSHPRIIVVNGSGSLGVLKNYRVDAVEGIDAAIRQIGQTVSATMETAATNNAITDRR